MKYMLNFKNWVRGELMLTLEVVRRFFGVDYENYKSRYNLDINDILFVIKLDNVKKKKIISDQNRKTGFGSLFNELASTVVDKVTIITESSYIIGMKDDSLHLLIALKDVPSFSTKFDKVATVASLENDKIKIELSFVNSPALDKVEINITTLNLALQKIGNLSDIVKFFFRNHININQHPIIAESFYRIKIFEQKAITVASNEGFAFKFKNESISLLGFDEDVVACLNSNIKVEKKDIVCYSCNGGVYSILTFIDNKYVLYTIASSKNETSAKETKFNNNNLIVNALSSLENDQIDSLLNRFIENIPKANVLMMALPISYGQDKIIKVLIKDDEFLTCIDDNVYTISSIFFKNQNLNIISYSGCNYSIEVPYVVIEQLDALSVRFDQYFNDEDKLQFVINDCTSQFETLEILENSVIINDITYNYVDIESIKVESMNGCCKVKMILSNGSLNLITAKEIAYKLWNKYEIVSLDHKIDTVSLEELYKYLNKLRLNRFLVGTFGEIIKANRIINMNMPLSEVMLQVSASENAVLRSYLKNLKSKFLEVDDLQAVLMKKVSLIELHRKNILALMNEWTIVYPHFMGDIEAKWLDTLYGDHISKDYIEKERWKTISEYKEILVPIEDRLLKMLAVINDCTKILQNSIPEEILAIDPTKKLRLSKLASGAEQFNVAANIALGIGAGANFIDQLTGGLSSMADPAYLIISTKIIAENFSKDSLERKNIKSFGSQVLSWWDNMMNILRVIIIDAIHQFTIISNSRVARDNTLIESLDELERSDFHEKLSMLITNELKEMSEDRFYETIPQYGIFVANIMDDFEDIALDYGNTLDSFKEHLIL
jgi:hypothetical protein